MKIIAKLLSVDVQLLEKALTQRIMDVNKQKLAIPFKTDQVSVKSWNLG
jgi:hypothetical protein